jgi:hypothetical protein
MNIGEAHIEFLVGIDKQSSGQITELPAEVIDLHLSNAQESFIKTRYGGNNIYKTGNEYGQKRTEDLRKIIVTSEIASTKVVDDYGTHSYIVVLPDNYMIYDKAMAVVKKANCLPYLSKVNLIQQDDYTEIVNDPFNKPYDLEPILYFEGDNIILESDGTFEIPKVKLTYFKYPQNVNVGTYGGDVVEFSLAQHTHREIIQTAIAMAIEIIQSDRVKTISVQGGLVE